MSEELHDLEKGRSLAEIVVQRTGTVTLLSDLAGHGDERTADLFGAPLVARLQVWNEICGDDIAVLREVHMHGDVLSYTSGELRELLSAADRVIDLAKLPATQIAA